MLLDHADFQRPSRVRHALAVLRGFLTTHPRIRHCEGLLSGKPKYYRSLMRLHEPRARWPAQVVSGALLFWGIAFTDRAQADGITSPLAAPIVQTVERHYAPARRRAITWPEGCDHFAEESGENKYSFERACAEAFDLIDWSVLTNSKNDDKCDHEFPADLRQDPDFTEPRTGYVKFHLLSQGRYLVEISCFHAPYNLGNVYVVYDETLSHPRAQLLKFPTYRFTEDGGLIKETTYVVGGRVFNNRKNELVAFVKYRGIGDCGTFARYVFPASEPVLREFRAKLDCDGKLPYQITSQDPQSPKGWTVYYPN
jgi:Protein of unknown function (DUF1176)